jgi:AcrR family transcriptional regulator
MDWSWDEVKELWADRLAAEPEPGLWLSAIGRAFVESETERPRSSPLWVQALGESSVDPEIAAYMRAHMHEVHEYVADVIRRAQEAGGVPPDRDPDAEAWIFIALGLLTMADEVVGALLQDAWPAIRESRIAWLRGPLHQM